jgi:PAS domain S-box-containing protein
VSLDATDLLRAEHAVARVLACSANEDEAFPELVATIGATLGCSAVLWLDGESDPAPLTIPLPGVGKIALSLDPDPAVEASLESLGSAIAQFVLRCRADARKSAILNAAFDAIITMDHNGNVVEVNRAAERIFGYRAEDIVGRELAEVIVPPSLREAHRRGVRRYLESGADRVTYHPLELAGMRADGSEFPCEVVITRAELPGPPLFCGFLRDITERRERERDQRLLMAEQAALRRVATAVAASTDPRHVFRVVTEEVGRLLGVQAANMVRFNGDGTGLVVGSWSEGGVRSVPTGQTVRIDGDTVSGRVYRSGAPARIDDYDEIEPVEHLAGLGFRCAVAAPIFLDGRMWGDVIASSIEPGPFPAGSEQRLASFAELAAQALANAESRAALAASRARIVAAGDDARRRLERNLHDGAQQRLVSLALTLRLAARRHADDPILAQAGEELTLALEELRELARGIHPAVLTEHGLEPAVASLAARAPLPVEISISLPERLPQPVEAAAYYVVAEALTNVAKYASASVVSVDVERSNGSARIEVRDDGVGGAAAQGGSGLRGLADRVEALGGRLELESPAGAGTTLRAEIPVN